MANKVRILVAEDEFIVAEDIRRNLVKIGYEVMPSVRTGEEAIDLAKRMLPDLVVLDIRLAGKVDGIQAAESILRIADVPIIYITAHSDGQTFERAKNTAPHAYIVKPFNFRNLHTAIELALFNFASKRSAKPGDLDDESASAAASADHYMFKDSIFLKTGKAFQKILFKDIQHVKASGAYSILNVVNKSFTLSFNLRTVEEKLNRPEFLRVHRSYIVNVNNIDRIDVNSVKVGSANIPVTRKVREQLLRRLDSI